MQAIINKKPALSHHAPDTARGAASTRMPNAALAEVCTAAPTTASVHASAAMPAHPRMNTPSLASCHTPDQGQSTVAAVANDTPCTTPALAPSHTAWADGDTSHAARDTASTRMPNAALAEVCTAAPTTASVHASAAMPAHPPMSTPSPASCHTPDQGQSTVAAVANDTPCTTPALAPSHIAWADGDTSHAAREAASTDIAPRTAPADMAGNTSSPTPHAPVNGGKSQWRRYLLAHRQNWSGHGAASAQLQQVLLRWLASRSDTVVAAYWPIRGEFDPLPALHQWLRDDDAPPCAAVHSAYDTSGVTAAIGAVGAPTDVGAAETGRHLPPCHVQDAPHQPHQSHAPRQIGLPVVDAASKHLRFHLWYTGCPMTRDRYGIPQPAGTPVIWPTLLLIPCVGYMAGGYRLGYGGGFYDRTLAASQPRPFTVGLAFAHSLIPAWHHQPHDVALDAILTEDGMAWPPCAARAVHASNASDGARTAHHAATTDAAPAPCAATAEPPILSLPPHQP